MKKLLALLALTLSTYAVEGHRIYIEPDFSWNFEHKFQLEDGTLKQCGQYYGLNAGYEYSAPSDLYASVQVLVSLGEQQREFTTTNDERFSDELLSAKNKLEGQVGYTFTKNYFSFTPFSGVGDYFFTRSGFSTNAAYLPLGVKAVFQLQDLCFGIKAEQLYFFHYWDRHDGTTVSGSLWGSPLGYEISLPISIGGEISKGEWRTAIEPYYLKLFDSLTFLGGRISSTYSF